MNEEMYYFTSDTHFGNEHVIGMDKRPFSSVNEMDRELIVRWNNKVKKEDDVWIIGDFIHCKNRDFRQYLDHLNGKKHLVCGNHDMRYLDNEVYTDYFESIDMLLEIETGGHTIVLCHYPLLEWDGYYRNFYHIHGHTHNHRQRAFEINKTEERALNCGCQITNYEPVSFQELIECNKRFKEGTGAYEFPIK